MRGELVIIRSDGTMSRSSISRPPSLDVLQRAVGGLIESIPYFVSFENTPCVAFCNEEGKLKRLPVNVLATGMWHAQRGALDVLVGDVAVVTGDRELLEGM